MMNFKLTAVAAVVLLASGCAQNAPVKPPAQPATNSPVASSTSSGASSTGTQQASPAAPAGRTREEVHAEAVEAVKHYKSTLQEELEYFQPH
jgi:hypothetical protein